MIRRRNKGLRIGFSGSSSIITNKQEEVFLKLLITINNNDINGISEFRHGDCIISDEKAHHLVRNNFKDVRIIIHPPEKHYKRAFCVGDETYPSKDFLSRNKEIVRLSNILVTTPDGSKERIRSGTWSTIRYARGLDRTIYIIYPDGSYDFEYMIEDTGEKVVLNFDYKNKSEDKNEKHN